MFYVLNCKLFFVPKLIDISHLINAQFSSRFDITKHSIRSISNLYFTPQFIYFSTYRIPMLLILISINHKTGSLTIAKMELLDGKRMVTHYLSYPLFTQDLIIFKLNKLLCLPSNFRHHLFSKVLIFILVHWWPGPILIFRCTLRSVPKAMSVLIVEAGTLGLLLAIAHCIIYLVWRNIINRGIFFSLIRFLDHFIRLIIVVILWKRKSGHGC